MTPPRLGAACAAGLTILCVSAPGSAGIGDFLADVGRAVGKPFGGFIEALVTPSLRAVDNTLIVDVDRRLGERIEQVNRTAGGVLDRTDQIANARIDQVNDAVAARLSQVDGIMAARIAQIGVTGNQLVDNAIGKLDGTLERNIARVGAETRKTLDELNRDTKQRLDQVDGILESRVNQLDGVVKQSIAEADQALEARLDQIDEISERRVGNLDVISTRQILNLESALTRIAALAATLTLVVMMLISLGRQLVKAWDTATQSGAFFQRLWLMADRKLFLSLARVSFGHAAVLAILLGILLLFSRKPSTELAARQQQLLAMHRSAFELDERNLDYRAALYNASQLAILEPATAAQYALRTRKLELIRDTLVRPAIFERPETVRALARQIATLGELIQRQTSSADPDLLTLQCYMRWQLAADRPAEAAAAADCGQALTVATQAGPSSSFLLASLARHYDAIVRFFPSWDAPGRAAQPAPDPLPGLEHIQSYDSLVQELDASSTSAYLALLDAQATLDRLPGASLLPRAAGGARATSATRRDPAQLAAAKQARLDAARRVIAAWESFDARLRRDEWITGTSSELAVFLLNDAVLTRALYVVAAPDADTLPGKIKDIADPFVRMRVVPPRVEWMRRYLAWLGDTARRVTTFEESKRFSNFEDELLAFERAYLALGRAGAATDAQRLAAARGAAQLALYVTKDGNRAPLARALLAGAAVPQAARDEIVALANARRLRLL
ncbi:MAG TPA: hypothetical protein VNN80_33470 [Polyangiaceae bacterium]|nr:hypothetical protein [Polyangiaceae bacterium]